jgi:hypothetical protein
MVLLGKLHDGFAHEGRSVAPLGSVHILPMSLRPLLGPPAFSGYSSFPGADRRSHGVVER